MLVIALIRGNEEYSATLPEVEILKQAIRSLEATRRFETIVGVLPS